MSTDMSSESYLVIFAKQSFYTLLLLLLITLDFNLFFYFCLFLGQKTTYSAAVTTLTDTACTYADYNSPRGGVAA